MKSDHRHELKTNELADWLVHLPRWLKENQTALIGTAAVVVVAIVVYFWIFYQNNIAAARDQVRLTNLVTQLPRQKAEIAQALSQKTDESFRLIDLAKDLQDFAQGEGSGPMAALALIERADALRAELHYRLGEVSPEDVTKQIGLAQESYTQAVEKARGNPALTATARLGLGLCEEELGNSSKAKEIYRTVAEDSAYAGTAAQAAAAFRLKTMDDYQGTVTFKPAPEPPAQAAQPPLQLKLGDANAPVIVPAPAPSGNAAEANSPAAATAPVTVPDANSSGGS